MKKIIIVVCVLMLLVLSASCASAPKITIDSLTTESNKTTEPKSGGVPNRSIGVRSLEQLEEMRKMAELEDEEALAMYLPSVEGGGAQSREDLINFLKLVDSLPIIEFIDGTVVWISHLTGYTMDAEGKHTKNYYDYIIVSTEAKNGDVTRVSYSFLINDVSAEMEKRKTEGNFIDSTLKSPIESKNGKIKVYCETREKHVSGEGDVINWTLDVDGIYTQVVYWTNDMESIVTENVFENVVVTNISDKK